MDRPRCTDPPDVLRSRLVLLRTLEVTLVEELEEAIDELAAVRTAMAWIRDDLAAGQPMNDPL